MGRFIVAECLLMLLACGSSSGDGQGDVEIQVINAQGMSQDSHLTLRVTTPRDTERRPFPYGDSTDSDNWVKLHLALNHGELVEFALETSTAAVEVSGTCIFDEPASGNYARARITPLDLGGGRHLDCAEGFVTDNL